MSTSQKARVRQPMSQPSTETNIMLDDLTSLIMAHSESRHGILAMIHTLLNAGDSITHKHPFCRGYINICFRGSILNILIDFKKLYWKVCIFLLTQYLSNIFHVPRPVLKSQFVPKNDTDKTDWLVEYDYERKCEDKKGGCRPVIKTRQSTERTETIRKIK